MPDVDDDAEGEAGGLTDEELLEDPVLELVAVADDVGLVVDVTDDDDDAVPVAVAVDDEVALGLLDGEPLGELEAELVAVALELEVDDEL